MSKRLNFGQDIVVPPSPEAMALAESIVAELHDSKPRQVKCSMCDRRLCVLWRGYTPRYLNPNVTQPPDHWCCFCARPLTENAEGLVTVDAIREFVVAVLEAP